MMIDDFMLLKIELFGISSISKNQKPTYLRVLSNLDVRLLDE